MISDNNSDDNEIKNSPAPESIHYSNATAPVQHPISTQPGANEGESAHGPSVAQGNEPETLLSNKGSNSTPARDGLGADDHDNKVVPAAHESSTDGEHKEMLGTVASEVAGEAGADVTGGDLTEHQDAGQLMDDNLAARAEEQTMWGQQQEGEVGAQTVDLKPAAAHPESGLPENPTNSENTGGSNASATEAGETDAAQKKSELEGNSSAADTTRAGVEHDEKFLRLAADFENYKRQAARRETEGRERAARSVIEDLLPVLDNFERAVDAARNAKDVESVRIGVEFIAQQFRDALKNHGVEPIDSKGQMFDPLRHDALEEVSGSDLPEGTVIDEAQRGYVYKGTVLRPSRVRVAGK